MGASQIQNLFKNKQQSTSDSTVINTSSTTEPVSPISNEKNQQQHSSATTTNTKVETPSEENKNMDPVNIDRDIKQKRSTPSSEFQPTQWTPKARR